MIKPLTERDIDTLAELDGFHRNMERIGRPHDGARPLDCGGSNGSHHSQTLKKLAARGLVHRKKYGGERAKGSCLYYITEEGREELRSRGRQAATQEEWQASLERTLAKMKERESRA